ncbi:MAG: transketolase [Bacilli bacterium]
MNDIALETLKVLAVEAIDEAQSGHPGIALGAASIVYTLYTRHLVATPMRSHWINRDRFVLSAGHGSALLYANLHLAGYKISIDDLKSFRQLGSVTPGHPEVDVTDGVDASSGPLGQGIAQSVGLAMAEAHLHAKFPCQINHYTYCLCGDGDLQEGVANEAMSLAGHLQLNKLIILYDSNDIQLDGPIANAYSDDIEQKALAIHWAYEKVEDGTNVDAISEAINRAKNHNRPTFIEIKTIIGLGASNQGTSSVHGSPLKHEEVLEMRSSLGSVRFNASKEAKDAYLLQKKISDQQYNQWASQITSEFVEFLGQIPTVDLVIPPFDMGSKMATRVSSGKVLQALSKRYTNLIGGSADLSASTHIAGADGIFSPDNRLGRNIKFGVREHAMAAIANGIALHGGLVPFVSGFFVFSDYMKPAIRLSALMKLPVLYIFTHDSIAVGEDGPTHQPIEQLTMLRSIPGLDVIRPADANEVRASYAFALASHAPVVIVLTRQELTTFIPIEDIDLNKGAYILTHDEEDIEGILIASGSEVALAVAASDVLLSMGHTVRVVSLPSSTLFSKQSTAYQEKILPLHIKKRLAIEMSDGAHLWRYVGLDGDVVGLSTFGKSAKGNILTAEMGFTVEALVKRYLLLR